MRYAENPEVSRQVPAEKIKVWTFVFVYLSVHVFVNL